jgi:flagellar basal-body rod protein FlgC
MSKLFSSLNISASGLSVFRRKMNIAAENMANAETTKTESGGPYKRKTLQIVGKDVPTTFSKELNRAEVKMTRTSNAHMPRKSVPRFTGTQVSYAESQERVDPNQKVRMVYDPSHPDADEEGFVAMPDIDPLVEMVNMMTASRAYEANITSIQAVKDMSKRALDI